MPRKYVKKLAVSTQEVQALSEKELEFLFGDLKQMLAEGQTICCSYEILRRYIKRKDSFDFSKPFNLRSYDKRCRAYNRMAENRRWMQKEMPIDFAEQERLSAQAADNLSCEFIDEVDTIEVYLNDLKRQMPQVDIERVLYRALNTDEKSIKILRELCVENTEVKDLIQELLALPVSVYLEAYLPVSL